ncbi:MAG TPA: hypothetical protein VHG33_06460 [Woeseiaceae bacterium]|nr:hypothetical protein [Woeseiaceae bacterium]
MNPQPMKAGNDRGPVTGALLYLLAGPLVWAGHLFLVYATQAALCAFRITGAFAVEPLLIPVSIAVLTVLAAAALVLALWRPKAIAHLVRAGRFLDGENGEFMISVMQLLAGLSLAGVIWAGATALLLDPCPQLR